MKEEVIEKELPLCPMKDEYNLDKVKFCNLEELQMRGILDKCEPEEVTANIHYFLGGLKNISVLAHKFLKKVFLELDIKKRNEYCIELAIAEQKLLLSLDNSIAERQETKNKIKEIKNGR